MGCDPTSVHAPMPCAGTQPLTDIGRLTVFNTFGIETSTNNPSPLCVGVIEPDITVAPESMRPQALAVTLVSSVTGGVQFPAGGGFQRQITPLSPAPRSSRLQGQSCPLDCHLLLPSFATLPMPNTAPWLLTGIPQFV